MLLIALLSGCGCPSFDDTEILDKDNLATGEQRDAIARALADFASWSDRDGACIDTIQVSGTLYDEGHHLAGQLNASWGTISVALSDPYWMYQVTVHELCHAVDIAFFDIPETQSHVYDGSSDAINPEVYETAAARSREDFADFCEWGPRDLLTLRAIDDACGGVLESPRSTFLNGEVFPAYQMPPAHGVTAVAPEPIQLPLPDDRCDALDAAMWRGELLVVTWGCATDQDTVFVQHFDATGELLGRSTAEPGRGGPWRIGVDGDDVVVFSDREITHIYRWREGEAQLERLPTVNRRPYADGITAGGHLWVWNGPDLRRRPLSATRWWAVEGPESGTYAPGEYAPIAISYTSKEPSGQRVYRWEDGTWAVHPLQDRLTDDMRVYAELDGGRLLVQWSTNLEKTGMNYALGTVSEDGATLLVSCDETDSTYSDGTNDTIRVWDEHALGVIHPDGTLRWLLGG